MRAGNLRKRVLLQHKQPAAVIDSEGNDVTPWQDVGYIWVQIQVPSVLAASGARGERIEAAQAEQLRPWAILARGHLRSVIDHNCRLILDGSRILDVRDVTDLGELHKNLRIDAMEKVY